ncbi:MAG: hypothetical protein WC443_00455 [Desulfobaccales bacterium]
MLEQNLIEGAPAGAHLAHTPPPPRLSAARCLAPLHQAIASVHRRRHQGQDQVIIRFRNGYGAIISESRYREGILEIAPVRFIGPGSNDYEFHFRSHVPDLTWGSDCDEIARVCRQIARLQPFGAK